MIKSNNPHLAGGEKHKKTNTKKAKQAKNIRIGGYPKTSKQKNYEDRRISHEVMFFLSKGPSPRSPMRLFFVFLVLLWYYFSCILKHIILKG